MSPVREPNLDPSVPPLRIHLEVLLVAAAPATLAILGVFEAGTERCKSAKDLPPHLLHCISQVKDTVIVFGLTGIAITIAAFTQAIQALETLEPTFF
ncbi:hypothetical protein FRC06_010889 [Ceratobasidium sp. 370]|nr:hypothetical protein FRC06_010889 [Ceratobasidium sp. 370]